MRLGRSASSIQKLFANGAPEHLREQGRDSVPDLPLRGGPGTGQNDVVRDCLKAAELPDTKAAALPVKRSGRGTRAEPVASKMAGFFASLSRKDQ